MHVLWSWLALCAVAYGMYVVAFVFESRVPWRDVPVWRDQSKAFLPGDAALALFIAAAPVNWGTSGMMTLLGLLVGMVALVVVRRVTYRPEDAPKPSGVHPASGITIS